MVQAAADALPFTAVPAYWFAGLKRAMAAQNRRRIGHHLPAIAAFAATPRSRRRGC